MGDAAAPGATQDPISPLSSSSGPSQPRRQPAPSLRELRRYPHLDLFPATPAQDLAAAKREHVEWGSPGLSVDEFVAREAELGTCDFARSGKRRRWVLAPVDDPTTENGFMAACETYRRGCYLAAPGASTPPRRQTCYSICSVFVRHEDRGKGYANEMIRRLHTKLAKRGEQALPWQGSRITGTHHHDPSPGVAGSDPSSAPPAYGLDAAASFLYSDVGAFYEPAGWRVMGHDQLEVRQERALTDEVPSSEARALDEAELPSIAALDEAQLREDLSATATATTSAHAPLRFCVSDPQANSWAWLIKRSKFFARLQRARSLREDEGPLEPVEWGAQLPMANKEGSRCPPFAVWMYDWSGAKPTDWHVEVLRLRHSSIEELALLLRAALSAALRHGMTRVVVWNLQVERPAEQLGPHLQGASLRLVIRESSLPCLAIYGPPSDDAGRAEVNVDGVQWLANEKGWWC